MLGEKVPFTARFTYQDPELTLSNLEIPRTEGLRISTLDGGSAHSSLIKNELFQVIEYKGFLYPEESKPSQSGIRVIGRLRADYSDSTTTSMGWPFAIGFDAFKTKKTMFSDPVMLHLDPLPRSAKPIQAIGTFTHFNASINVNEVAQGDAAILTLSLDGDGDAEKIKAPVLTVPDDVRFYESKSSVTPKGKKWDYVIQGIKQGRVTLPEQSFVYFDTATRTIKTLKTKPITLTITPGTVVKDSASEQVSVSDPSKSPSEQNSDPQPTGGYSELPLPFFIMLFLMPPGAALLRSFFPNIQAAAATSNRKIRALYAVPYASHRIKQACKKGDLSCLYAIIRTALIDHYSLENISSDDELIKALHDVGWGKETVQQWIAFSRKLLSYTQFAPQTTVNMIAQTTSVEATPSQAGTEHVNFEQHVKSHFKTKYDVHEVRAVAAESRKWLRIFRKGTV